MCGVEQGHKGRHIDGRGRNRKSGLKSSVYLELNLVTNLIRYQVIMKLPLDTHQIEKQHVACKMLRHLVDCHLTNNALFSILKTKINLKCVNETYGRYINKLGPHQVKNCQISK